LIPTRSHWFFLLSLVLVPAASAASKEPEPPDREMLRMMDFLKDMEVIKNLEMMKEVRQLEQMGDQPPRNSGPPSPPAKRKEGIK